MRPLISSKALQQSFHLEARGIARINGLKLKWGGDPSINLREKVIHLPHVPMIENQETLDKVRKLFRRWVAHEAGGHGRYTDPKALDRWESVCQETPLIHSLANALEDPRIEILYQGDYRGVQGTLDEGLQVMIKDGQVRDGSKGPADALTVYALLYGRLMVQGQGFVEELFETARSHLVEHLTENGVAAIDGVLSNACNLTSTEDAYQMSQQIVTMVKEMAEEEPDEEDPQQPSPGQGQQQQQQQQQGAKSILEDDAPPSAPDDAAQAFAEAVDQANDEASVEAKSAGAAMGDDNEVVIAPDEEAEYHLLRESLAGDVVTLRTRAAALFAARVRSYRVPTEQAGRVRPKNLSRLRVGDQRIYSRQVKRQMPGSAVAIAGDLSGSMSQNELEMVEQVMAASAEVMESIRVPFALYGFGGKNTHVAGLVEAKPFHRPFRGVQGRIPGLRKTAGGTTPMTEALLEIGLQLAARDESRKILICVTDGGPNNRESATDMAARLMASGILTVGIGMGTDAGRDIFERWSSIESSEQLGQALLGALVETLLAA